MLTLANILGEQHGSFTSHYTHHGCIYHSSMHVRDLMSECFGIIL